MPADEPLAASSAKSTNSEGKPQKQQKQNNLLVGPPPACWKSTPGDADGQQLPRLSLSAILPLSAVGGGNDNRQPPREQASQKEKHKKPKQNMEKEEEDSPDRTMLPAAAAAAPSAPPGSRLRRFFSNPGVRRSLAIDAAAVLIFVPLSISTSLALARLFARRANTNPLEWYHYLLVAALASLVLVPACRLAYSCHRYRRRLRRMAQADLGHCGPRQRLADVYTTKSRRIEAADAARALEYRQFASLVAKQQNIELSRRQHQQQQQHHQNHELSVPEVGAADVSGLSCHRPDISMAAYNC